MRAILSTSDSIDSQWVSPALRIHPPAAASMDSAHSPGSPSESVVRPRARGSSPCWPPKEPPVVLRCCLGNPPKARDGWCLPLLSCSSPSDPKFPPFLLQWLRLGQKLTSARSWPSSRNTRTFPRERSQVRYATTHPVEINRSTSCHHLAICGHAISYLRFQIHYWNRLLSMGWFRCLSAVLPVSRWHSRDAPGRSACPAF